MAAFLALPTVFIPKVGADGSNKRADMSSARSAFFLTKKKVIADKACQASSSKSASQFLVIAGNRLYSAGTDSLRVMKWRLSVDDKPGSETGLRKRVYIVRKGQSSWNVEGRVQGRSDVSALNELGVTQASRIADALQHVDFDKVFSSPLIRAKQTTEIILARNSFAEKPPSGGKLVYDGRNFAGFPLTYLPELEEINLGDWEGLTRDQVQQRFGNQFETWQTAPSELTLSNGRRPVYDLWNQAMLAWNDILASDASNTLVVAHNAVNRALLGTALGLPPTTYKMLLQSYGAINTLVFTQRGDVELEAFNNTVHMK